MGKRDESATDSQDDSDVDKFNPAKFRRNSGPFLKKIKIKGYDTTDALPKRLNFDLVDILGIFISIGSYFFDVSMDILVAYVHYTNGNKWFFALTVCFIAVPSLAMTGFSLRWYLVDADTKTLPKVSLRRWIIRLVFLVLQLGPVLRYIDSLYYGMKSNRAGKDKIEEKVNCYKMMIYEDADATLLRLFESFMEAAPQLVLQLYIYAQSHVLTPNMHDATQLIQIVSMFSSLGSISWALASFQRANRYSQTEKKNMTWCGTTVQILWRFFDIASRVLALGLFASLFPTYMFVVCGTHYVIMFIWIRMMKTTFCENNCGEFLYNIILGVVFIFCYFNPKDSPTRRRYTFFYVLTFLENSAMMSVWFVYAPPTTPYKYSAMFLQFLCFLFAVILMIIYYLLLHPTKKINVWDHWKKSKTSDVDMHNGDIPKEGAQTCDENRV